MSIIRVVKDSRERFLLTDSEIHYRKDISWEAKGLHAYLMTKHKDWTVSFSALLEAGTAKKDKMQRMIRELKDAGYMSREQYNDPETGKFVTVSNVYETLALNPSSTPICGGTVLTVAGNPATDRGGFTVDGLTVAGKPGSIVSNKDKDIYKGDQLIKNYEHDSESIPGAYTEPPFEQVNSMISTLSGICKGFANVLQPEDCEFHKAAILLIEKEYTEEEVRAFGPWWEKNGYYQGKPAVKSLLDEIGNSVDGITPIDTQIHNAQASKSWKECSLWIDRTIGVDKFSDPLTIQVVRQIGEGTMRKISSDNSRSVKKLFFELYGDLAKQNGA